MNRKNVMVNCVGFIITFSLLALTFVLYNAESGSMFLSYASGGYNLEADEASLAEYEFVDTVDFEVLSSEQAVIYSGVSDLGGVMFSLSQSNHPIEGSIRLTGKNGETEIYDMGPIEQSQAYGAYLRKGVDVELLLCAAADTPVEGRLYVYYIKRGY